MGFIVFFAVITSVEAGTRQPTTPSQNSKQNNASPSEIDKVVTVNQTQLDNILKKRHVVDQSFVNPQELAGSILYKDRSGAWSFRSVLPLTAKTTFVSDSATIITNTYDKKMALNASLSYVVTLGGDMDSEDKATLLLQDIYTVTAPSLNKEIQANITSWAKFHPSLASNGSVVYVQAVQVSLLTSSIYKLVEGKANFTGPFILLGGKQYALNSNTANTSVISIDTDEPDELPAAVTPLATKNIPTVFKTMNQVK